MPIIERIALQRCATGIIENNIWNYWSNEKKSIKYRNNFKTQIHSMKISFIHK